MLIFSNNGECIIGNMIYNRNRKLAIAKISIVTLLAYFLLSYLYLYIVTATKRSDQLQTDDDQVLLQVNFSVNGFCANPNLYLSPAVAYLGEGPFDDGPFFEPSTVLTCK